MQETRSCAGCYFYCILEERKRGEGYPFYSCLMVTPNDGLAIFANYVEIATQVTQIHNELSYNWCLFVSVSGCIHALNTIAPVFIFNSNLSSHDSILKLVSILINYQVESPVFLGCTLLHPFSLYCDRRSFFAWPMKNMEIENTLMGANHTWGRPKEVSAQTKWSKQKSKNASSDNSSNDDRPLSKLTMCMAVTKIKIR